MKVECRCIGKTDSEYLKAGLAVYCNRLVHYVPFEFVVLGDVKNGGTMARDILRQKEGELILSKLNKEDMLILLDEHGFEFDSVQFASFLENKMSGGVKKIVFQIGGAYGFSEEVRNRANFSLSLSKMTFSHQMVRLFFCEQLYRAFTIIKKEKYHNP